MGGLAAGESLALGSGARGRLSNPGRGEASPKVDSLEARHCFQSAELLAQPCEFFAGAFAGHGLLSPLGANPLVGDEHLTADAADAHPEHAVRRA